MATKTLEQTDSDQNRRRVLAAGGMLGAVLAATVTFDNELTTDILIAAASTNVGYPASVIETETQ